MHLLYGDLGHLSNRASAHLKQPTFKTGTRANPGFATVWSGSLRLPYFKEETMKEVFEMKHEIQTVPP